jgi:hypothetical protein
MVAYMLKLLRDPKDITQAQKRFCKRFHVADAEKRRVRIAHRGEVHNMEVTWLPSERVWAGSRKLINRYWNVFGVGEPKRQTPNGITCEINFPLHGINRRIAGLLAKDSGGIVRVFHRGNIRGKPGVGLGLFRKYYRGKWHLVDGQKVVLIGAISEPKFVRRISRFVREVQSIKSKVR